MVSQYVLLARQSCQWNIPGIRGASASIRLSTDVGVLVLVSEFEPKVVHDVAGVIDNVGALAQLAGGSLAAQDLELGNIVGMSGGRKASKNALLGKEE